jgi:hypothetical protein
MEEQGKGAGRKLTTGVMVWLGNQHSFTGKVAAELNFANDRGVMGVVAMQRPRLIHLAMLHLGYMCECKEALELADFINNLVFTLSQCTGRMTDADWAGLGEMVYNSMGSEAQEDTRIELTALRLEGKHREPPTIHLARELPRGM